MSTATTETEVVHESPTTDEMLEAIGQVLVERLDRVKYHKEYEVSQSWLEDLISDLDRLSEKLAVESEDTRLIAEQNGYNQALTDVRQDILENAKLKRRGDMIDKLVGMYHEE